MQEWLKLYNKFEDVYYEYTENDYPDCLYTEVKKILKEMDQIIPFDSWLGMESGGAELPISRMNQMGLEETLIYNEGGNLLKF